ncbi:hypothetical protein BT69DRAFT_1328552 [Atractiella rhizophila]|nr:hypothetical protein BT69DRAFT_1328552 [Atractiella rhizophila]
MAGEMEAINEIDFSQILVDSGTPGEEVTNHAEGFYKQPSQQTSPSLEAQDLAATILSMDLNTQHSVLSALLSKQPDAPMVQQHHSAPTSPYPFVNPAYFSTPQLPTSASFASLPTSTQPFMSAPPIDGLTFNSQISPSMTPMTSVFSPISAFSSCPPSQQIQPVNLPMQLLQQQHMMNAIHAGHPFVAGMPHAAGVNGIGAGEFSPLTSPAIRPEGYQNAVSFASQTASMQAFAALPNASPFLPPSNPMQVFPQTFVDPSAVPHQAQRSRRSSQTRSPAFPSSVKKSKASASPGNGRKNSISSSKRARINDGSNEPVIPPSFPMDASLSLMSNSVHTSPIFDGTAAFTTSAPPSGLLNSLRSQITTNPSSSPSPVDLDKAAAMAVDSNLVHNLSNPNHLHPFAPPNSIAPLTPADLMKLPHELVSGASMKNGLEHSQTYSQPANSQPHAVKRKSSAIQSDDEDSQQHATATATSTRETRQSRKAASKKASSSTLKSAAPLPSLPEGNFDLQSSYIPSIGDLGMSTDVTQSANKSTFQTNANGKGSDLLELEADSLDGLSNANGLPKETRKTSHKAAEQKRRDSLKHCFDDLRKILPPIVLLMGDNEDERRPGEGNVGGQRSGHVDPSNPNKGVSKVALLRRSNEYILKLHDRMDQRDQLVRDLRETIFRLRSGDLLPIQSFETEQPEETEPLFKKGMLMDIAESDEEEEVAPPAKQKKSTTSKGK